MVTRLLKAELKTIPTGITVDDKAIEFLNDFILDFHETYYLLDKDMLDESLIGWNGKEPPKELVDFLYKQLEEDDSLTLVIG